MSTLEIQTAKVFKPLLEPSRYLGAKGGRGSAKSHFFAGKMVEECLRIPGTRAVCLREVQRDLKESAKLLIEDKIERHGLGAWFNVQRDQIITPGGGLIIFRGMNDLTAHSIKSLESFRIAWWEEAHTATSRSIELLRPTMRTDSEGRSSEIWFSWNPTSTSDPIDKFLVTNPPDNAVVVTSNWRDNPWFPAVLEEERLYDWQFNRDRYAHIWEGDYEPAVAGAIWDRASIETYRLHESPPCDRIVVAVDPAVSSEPGADEHGIVVCGRGEDRNGYVLDDVTTSGSPDKWARRAIAAYDHWQADAIVIEVNQGGDMVRHTLQTQRPGVRIIPVHATRGKHVRAEPISALYNLGRIRHIGAYPELEHQMCQMTNKGYEGDGSPDRVDALVWGFTELFPAIVRKGQTMQPTVAQTDFRVFA